MISSMSVRHDLAEQKCAELSSEIANAQQALQASQTEASQLHTTIADLEVRCSVCVCVCVCVCVSDVVITVT